MNEMKNKAAPPAVAVPDERAAFEAWYLESSRIFNPEIRDWTDEEARHICLNRKDDGEYRSESAMHQWEAWQARAALAAAPSDHAEQALGMVDADPAADAPVNAWQQAVDKELVSAHLGVAGDVTPAEAAKALHELICWNIEVATNPQTNGGKVLVPAAAPVVPEPVIVEWWSSENGLEDCDMAKRDDFIQVVRAIEAKLRALLATATAPTEPFGYFKAEPFGWTDCGPDDEGAVALYEKPQAMLAIGGQAQAVEQGEVLVTVSGFTGSGKSAIAGEIEILCRALGLQVEWPDGESEKNMTHADWTAALEQYKPRVRIVEQNIPFISKKGLSK